MDSLLALLMLGGLAASLATLVRAARRRTLDRPASRLTAAVSATGLLLVLLLLHHYLYAVNFRETPRPSWLLDILRVLPVRQLAVGALCCFVFTLTASDLRRRLAAFVLTGIYAYGLVALFYTLGIGNTDRFITLPSYAGRVNLLRCERVVIEATHVLQPAAANRHTAYPAGWLSDSALLKALPADDAEYLRWLASYQRDRGPCTLRIAWHSWLTGLSVLEPQPWDFWYTGGAPTDLRRQLQARVRE